MYAASYLTSYITETTYYIPRIHMGPKVIVASIDVTGSFLTIHFDRSVSGNIGFTVPGWTITYISGNGTNQKLFSISPIVQAHDNPLLNYDPGNVVDIDSDPLLMFHNRPILNYSTIGGYIPAYQFNDARNSMYLGNY